MSRTCSECAAPIPVPVGKRLTCSPRCSVVRSDRVLGRFVAVRSDRRRTEREAGKVCACGCGEAFVPRSANTRYKSVECKERGLQLAINRQKAKRAVDKLNRESARLLPAPNPPNPESKGKEGG